MISREDLNNDPNWKKVEKTLDKHAVSSSDLSAGLCAVQFDAAWDKSKRLEGIINRERLHQVFENMRGELTADEILAQAHMLEGELSSEICRAILQLSINKKST